MEDEKWQDNFASERTDRSREGYKPFDSENNNQGTNRTVREGRVMRPRIQRAEACLYGQWGRRCTGGTAFPPVLQP